jgi:hypothetical protein
MTLHRELRAVALAGLVGVGACGSSSESISTDRHANAAVAVDE